MERLQSGPVLRAAGVTLIPITRVAWAASGRPMGVLAEIIPLAVAVIGPEGEIVWRVDGKAEPLHQWIEEVPGLEQLVAQCR